MYRLIFLGVILAVCTGVQSARCTFNLFDYDNNEFSLTGAKQCPSILTPFSDNKYCCYNGDFYCCNAESFFTQWYIILVILIALFFLFSLFGSIFCCLCCPIMCCRRRSAGVV